MKRYKLTPEHETQLPAWRDKWIANAMSTKHIDKVERAIVRKAVRGLYEAAGFVPPSEHRIVFVGSPLMAAFVAGFAAWVWKSRENRGGFSTDATHAAINAATRDAINAINAATHAATNAATNDATRDATYDATYDATNAATHAATDAAINDATHAATDDATDVNQDGWYTYDVKMSCVADKFGDPTPMLECASKSWEMRDGGNQWSGWCSYLSFFRWVVGLKIDYSRWDHYEKLCEHSGPRYMHKEFCIVSDRPELLLVDENNRPHCENGPFCRWRDGFSLYAIHGVRVPAWVVLTPERISVEDIKHEQNAEVRRIMRERYGEGRYLVDTGAKILDVDGGLGVVGSAPRMLVEDNAQQRWLVGTDGSTKRVYYMRVPVEISTCREAHNALAGIREEDVICEC